MKPGNDETRYEKYLVHREEFVEEQPRVAGEVVDQARKRQDEDSNQGYQGFAQIFCLLGLGRVGEENVLGKLERVPIRVGHQEEKNREENGGEEFGGFEDLVKLRGLTLA